jgi:AraC-like DNA-binding protein
MLPTMADYREQAPPPHLEQWVECAWSMETAVPVASHRVPPDGCLDIVYDRRDGLRAIGAMTVEQRFPFPEHAWVAGVRFRPGMASPFLGISPAELTDRAAAMDDLRPARELARRLDDARSIRDAMRILLGSLQPPEAAPNPVQQAVGALTLGEADLDTIAGHANLSPRQFRRRCLEESGLTPKRLCRVLRFRRVCGMASGLAHPDWAAIALEAGYFDQAHLIHDFHEFTGLTPMAVFSNTGAGLPG